MWREYPGWSSLWYDIWGRPGLDIRWWRQSLYYVLILEWQISFLMWCHHHNALSFIVSLVAINIQLPRLSSYMTGWIEFCLSNYCDNPKIRWFNLCHSIDCSIHYFLDSLLFPIWVIFITCWETWNRYNLMVVFVPVVAAVAPFHKAKSAEAGSQHISLMKEKWTQLGTKFEAILLGDISCCERLYLLTLGFLL